MIFQKEAIELQVDNLIVKNVIMKKQETITVLTE